MAGAPCSGTGAVLILRKAGGRELTRRRAASRDQKESPRDGGNAMKPVDRIIECDLPIQDVEVMMLEDNVRDVRRWLAQAFNHNEKLVTALSEAREQMGLLKE